MLSAEQFPPAILLENEAQLELEPKEAAVLLPEHLPVELIFYKW